MIRQPLINLFICNLVSQCSIMHYLPLLTGQGDAIWYIHVTCAWYRQICVSMFSPWSIRENMTYIEKSAWNLYKFMFSRESTVLLVMVLSLWSVRLECRSLVYPNIPWKYSTFGQPACAYCCSLKTSRDFTAANFTAGINRSLRV